MTADVNTVREGKRFRMMDLDEIRLSVMAIKSSDETSVPNVKDILIQTTKETNAFEILVMNSLT